MIALGSLAVVVITTLIIAWNSGYGAGLSSSGTRERITATQGACVMLGRTRHDLASHHQQTDALRATMTEYGCR